MLKRGTLLIPSGPEHDPDRKHLHIVCTNPCQSGRQLLLPVCSFDPNRSDTTCVLEAFEHDWLQHKSYIEYRYASKRAANLLDAGIEQNIFRDEGEINMQTFLRIVRGIERSAFMAPVMKQYYLVNR